MTGRVLEPTGDVDDGQLPGRDSAGLHTEPRRRPALLSCRRLRRFRAHECECYGTYVGVNVVK